MAHDDLRQLLDLVSFLHRHENTTEAEIASLLGCAPADVQRMLDRLLMCGTPPYSPRDYVCVCRDQGHLRGQFADHFRRPVNVSPVERACLLAMLADAAVGLPAARDSVRATLRQKLENLGADATAAARAPADTLRRNPGAGHDVAQEATRDEPSASEAIAIGGPGARVNRIAEALQSAIHERSRVRLLHLSTGQFALRERIVDPYALRREREFLYLIAFDRTSRQRVVQFRLDRIARVERAPGEWREPLADEVEQATRLDGNTPVARPASSSHQAADSSSPTNKDSEVANSPAPTFTFWVHERLVAFVQERFGRDNVTLLDAEATAAMSRRVRKPGRAARHNAPTDATFASRGGALVTLPLISEAWVIRLVLGYGEDAELMEPKHLRAKLAALALDVRAQLVAHES